MKIKQLDLRDLKPDLRMPDEHTLHVWTFTSDAPSNVHKNVHEHSHALLYKLLSCYLKYPEDKLILGTEEHGKPCLLPPAEKSRHLPPLHFNLSHAGSYIVFIFSSCTPVGIDIESTRRKANMDRIASRLFLPEEISHLKELAGEEKTLYFFHCWTRMESLLKGIGTGLSATLNDKHIQEERALWELKSVPAPEGYLCCAAYRIGDGHFFILPRPQPASYSPR